TLRDAIAAANSNVAVSPGGPVGSATVADEIRFNLLFSVFGATITLNQGQLEVRSDLTITGPGATKLSISGNNLTRVVDVTDSSFVQRFVSISGLTIASGNSPTFNGGGILNRERLTLQNCTVRGNRAFGDGGGIWNATTENTATLIVQNSTISSNFANTGGGIRNDGALSILSSTISGNEAA